MARQWTYIKFERFEGHLSLYAIGDLHRFGEVRRHDLRGDFELHRVYLARLRHLIRAQGIKSLPVDRHFVIRADGCFFREGDISATDDKPGVQFITVI